MEWSLFSKFSWFLVLTTLSQRLSGYFTSLWYLALNQASKFAVYGLLALSSSPHLSLLCPVSPVDCAAPTPVLTAFIRRGLPTGRHRHEKPRTVPQPPCLGKCPWGSCTSFWLQFPLDSSSFWRVVSALGLQKNDLIFLPRDGGGAYDLFLDCSTIPWRASCSSINFLLFEIQMGCTFLGWMMTDFPSRVCIFLIYSMVPGSVTWYCKRQININWINA